MKLQGPLFFVAASVLLTVPEVSSSAGGSTVGGPAYSYSPQQQHWYGQQGLYGQQQQHQEEQKPLQKQSEQASGEEKREDLQPLPDGWTEHFDPASGQYYYYNASDGTTTWDRPSPPEGTESKEEPPPLEDDQESGQAFPDSVSEMVAEISPSYQNRTSSVNDEPTSSETMSPDSRHPGQGHPSSAELFPKEPTSTSGEDRGPHIQQPCDGQTRPSSWQPQGPGWGMPDGGQEKRRAPAGWGITNYRIPQPATTIQEGNRQPQTGTWQRQQAPQQQRANQQQPAQQQQPHQHHQDQKSLQILGWGIPNEPARGERPRDSIPLYQQGWGAPQQGQGGPNQGQGAPSQAYGIPPQGQDGPPRAGSGPPGPDLNRPVQQQPFYPQPGTDPQRAAPGEHRPALQHQQQASPRQGYPGQPYSPPPQYSAFGQPGVYPGGHYGQDGQQGYPSAQLRPQGQMVPQEESPVKEALGGAWKSILGLTGKTREAVSQATETVAKQAAEATQSLSATSSSWLDIAKSSVGALFEGGGNDARPDSYSLSGQQQTAPRQPGAGPPPGYPQQPQRFGYPPQQGYPPRTQGYPPQQGQQRRPPGYPEQQGLPQQGRYPPQGYQPRRDPPYPQPGQSQQRDLPPLQSQWGGANSQGYPPQQGGGYPPRQGPQYGQGQGLGPGQGPPGQLGRPQQGVPNPWSHPGLDGER